MDKATKSGIKLFVINVGKTSELPNLKKMIHQMEGYFYEMIQVLISLIH